MAVDSSDRVYAGVDLEEPDIQKLTLGTAIVYTHKSPGKPTGNEDSVAVIQVTNDTAVLAVADGLGGVPAGDVASKLVVQSICKSLYAIDEHQLREAILNGIDHANKEILALGIGAGTTLAIAEIRKNILRTYHVGDAGIIVMGQRGRLRLQTLAHSPTGYAVEAGLINEAEALDHKERNLVSNVVGSRDLRIEIGSLIKLAPRDTVVVASDGLFDNFLTNEIISRVRCGKLLTAANSIITESFNRMAGLASNTATGYPDDLSLILYRPSMAAG